MIRPRHTTTRNLFVHGYAKVAETFKASFYGQGSQKKALVIAPNGRVIYFRYDEPIPPAFQSGVIGWFTKGVQPEVVEDALIHHLKTCGK